jgi:hypothetical protein
MPRPQFTLRTLSGCQRLASARESLEEEPQSESRMREIRPSGFDEREVETEHGLANEAPADERAGTG